MASLPSRRRRWPVAAALVVALVVPFGCSSSDAGAGGTSSPVGSPSSSAAPATTTTAVPTTPSGGCGTAAPVAEVSDDRPGDVAQTFSSGGVDRTYRLGIPAGYDPDEAVPLVVNLHGSGSDALQASTYSDLARSGSERHMVVVGPEALDGKWELAGTGADADFLRTLVDDLEARLCIDEARVHLIGMSLGAWKAAATACAETGRYASIALVTVEVFPGTCEPLPVVAFHGTADPVAAYGEGGGTVDDADTPNAGITGTLANMAGWADNGGCDARPEESTIGDDVTVRRFTGCDPGIDVALYTIEGGGHTWPGADIDIAAPELTTRTIDATELALDWFEAHPRHP